MTSPPRWHARRSPHAPTRLHPAPGIASRRHHRQISRPVGLPLGAWPARVTVARPCRWSLGPAVGDALGRRRAGPVQLVASIGAVGRLGRWCLVATLVPTTVSLTVLRVAAPAAVAAAMAATVAEPGRRPAAAVAAGGRARRRARGLLARAPGEAFVAGSSYGDERRLPLRVPGPLLAGPLAAGVGRGGRRSGGRSTAAGGPAVGRGRSWPWRSAYRPRSPRSPVAAHAGAAMVGVRAQRRGGARPPSAGGTGPAATGSRCGRSARRQPIPRRWT